MTKKKILELRKKNKLHKVIESRIKALFDKVAPGSFTIKEGYGVTSGRTDTTTFLTKGRVIHVEVIASESMVFRDVTNLHQSSADLCITVLLDEKYDPKVAKAYYRANSKNIFPTVWLSDVLDVKKEDYVLGRLDELLQGLDRQVENITAKVQTQFNDFVVKLGISTTECRTMHLGLFSRRSLGLFEKVGSEDDLFHKFEPMGIVSAANPINWTEGMGWFFSHDGQFFIIREGVGEANIYTQLAIGDSGAIIFTFADEKNRIEEIFASGIRKMFNPTFKFVGTILEAQKYDGMVDILATLTGLMSKQWIPQGGENHLSRLIRGRIFYEDKIITPVKSYTLEELKTDEINDEFYKDLFIQLQRNTRRTPWSSN